MRVIVHGLVSGQMGAARSLAMSRFLVLLVPTFPFLLSQPHLNDAIMEIMRYSILEEKGKRKERGLCEAPEPSKSRGLWLHSSCFTAPSSAVCS